MKWLLIFVWVSGSQVELTTEQFDTLAECDVAGTLLKEEAYLPSYPAEQERWFDCRQIKPNNTAGADGKNWIVVCTISCSHQLVAPEARR